METKRLFIAINLPAELRSYLAKIQAGFQKEISNVKWVEESNFHLTLKFLGEVPIDVINEISYRVKKAIDKINPFYISFSELGVFPNKNQAKVIWLGIDEGKGLVIDIFKNIDLALETIGFKKEGKAYKPHLTLGRCREPKFIDINKLNSGFNGRCLVNSVDIMMSHLTPKGPIYSVIESIYLFSE